MTDHDSPYMEGPEAAPSPDDLKQQVADLGHQFKSVARSSSSVVNRWLDDKWRRDVREADDASLVPSAFSIDRRWLDLAEVGARYAVLAAKNALSPTAPVDLAFAVLRALIEVDQAQAELLTSIDENVRLLRDGPFASGRILLSEAERLASHDIGESVSLLKSSRQRFYDALPLTTEPIDTAVVQSHVALTCLLLSDPSGAGLWLRRAHGEVLPLARSLAEKTGETSVAGSKWLVPLSIGLPYTAAYVLLRKRFNIARDERARIGLRRTLPFIDMIATVHNGLGSGEEDLPSLELIRVHRDQYELRAMVGTDGVNESEPPNLSNDMAHLGRARRIGLPRTR